MSTLSCLTYTLHFPFLPAVQSHRRMSVSETHRVVWLSRHEIITDSGIKSTAAVVSYWDVPGTRHPIFWQWKLFILLSQNCGSPASAPWAIPPFQSYHWSHCRKHFLRGSYSVHMWVFLFHCQCNIFLTRGSKVHSESCRYMDTWNRCTDGNGGVPNVCVQACNGSEAQIFVKQKYHSLCISTFIGRLGKKKKTHLTHLPLNTI